MSNVEFLRQRDAAENGSLDWLARALEACLKNDSTSEAVVIALDRADAVQLVLMIDRINEGGRKDGSA